MSRSTARLRRPRPAARARGKHPTFLLFALVVSALAVLPSPANAALPTAPAPSFDYVQDEQGADDQPGQKDLNQHAVASPTPGSLWVSWKWDVTSLSGGNTGDACALFDRNANGSKDGKIDFAVCVTIAGNPAVQLAGVSPRVYTCGNGKVDRCTSTYAQVLPINTGCSVSRPANSDVFHAGQSDTVAVCNIALADVGATQNVTPTLVNTCSYPSQQPTSDPSDCVLAPRDAFLRVSKNAPSGSFGFKVWTGATEPGSATVTVNGGATSDWIPIRTDVTYNVKEIVPATWAISGTPSCTGATTSNGSFSGATISGIDAAPDNQVTCTFTDVRLTGAIKVTKRRTGTTTGLAGAKFTIDGANEQTTDSNGEVCFTGVSIGNHTVAETQAPNGHAAAAPASQSVTVSDAATGCGSGAAFATATFYNPLVPGEIDIHKSGVNGADLPGVTFTLYANNGTQAAPRGNDDTVTSYSCTTNSEGDCTISGIPLGNYWIVETVPAGYIGGADQALTIGVGDAPGEGDNDQSFSFENSAAPGTIVITKTGVGGLPLPGAVFTLYRDTGLNAGVAGSVRDTGLGQDPSTGSTCTSDVDGLCTFNDVAPGHYWIVETTVPAGYTQADEQQVEVLFGTAAGQGYTATPEVENQPVDGTVSITKTDDAGNALEGAEFTLFADADPTDGDTEHASDDTDTGLSCTTDGDGLCDITAVPLGKYWVVETVTPDHHDTAADRAIVVGLGDAAETGDQVELTIENDRQHRVVVIVCHEGTDTLAPRDVTVGPDTKESIGAGSLTAAQQKALCDTGGASFGDISGHGEVDVTVEAGSGH